MSKAIEFVGDLRLKYITRTIDFVRMRWFTRSWPENRPHFAVRTDLDAEEFEQVLRNDLVLEGVQFTFNYEGEIINLRGPYGTRNGYQREIHVRFRPWEHGFEGNCHTEKSRYEHKDEHYAGKELDWQEGYSDMVKLLEELDFDVVREDELG